MLRLAALVIVAIATAACHPLSADEQRLVGAWDAPGIDSTSTMEFRPDHAFVMTDHPTDYAQGGVTRAKWRLQEDLLMITFADGTEERFQIVSVTPAELTYRKDGGERHTVTRHTR
jgi:hypothetical protein